MGWIDDATDQGPSAAPLTTRELAAIAQRVGGFALQPPLAAAVERHLAANAAGLVEVMRCLLVEDPAVARARLERLVAREAADSAAVATPDRAVLRRCGDLWEVEYAGRGLHLRHARGLTYLAELVARPGQPLWSCDLVARGGGSAPQDLARLSVTKAIGSILTRLAAVHPELHAHLAVTVRRGNFCVYTPDPHRPIRWVTGADGTTVPSQFTPSSV